MFQIVFFRNKTLVPNWKLCISFSHSHFPLFFLEASIFLLFCASLPIHIIYIFTYANMPIIYPCTPKYVAFYILLNFSLCIIIIHSMYNFINLVEFSHFCFKIYPSWVILGLSLHLVNTDSLHILQSVIGFLKATYSLIICKFTFISLTFPWTPHWDTHLFF